MTEPSSALTVVDKTIPLEYIGKLEPNYYCRAWNGKVGRMKYCRARAGAGTDHPGAGRCRHHDGGASGKLTHGQERRYAGLQAPRIRELVEHFAADAKPWDVRPELDVARALFTDWVERYHTFIQAITAWHDSWEGKYVPLSLTESRALVHVLDEYESMLAEEEATAKQRQDLELARSAITFLSMKQESKPRQILDVADAMRHVDTISKVIHRAEQIRQHGSISIERVRLFMLAIDRELEIEVPDDDQRKRIRKGISAIRI